MKSRLFTFIAIALTAMSCLTMLPAQADNLYTSKTRPRNVDDSVGVQTLFGKFDIAPDPRSSSSGLGNRIGIFQLQARNPADRETSYVRAKICLYSSQRTNDNETVGRVEPVAGPYPDGTFIWAIGANYRPDEMRANCYFDGSAGIFRSEAFTNYENIASSTRRTCMGFNCADYTTSTQTDFVTGATKSLGSNYGAFTYSPCEAAPGSAECFAQTPPPSLESCAAQGLDYSPYDANYNYVGAFGGSCTPYRGGGGSNG